MQALDRPHDISKTSLGDRRGIIDLARCCLDLTWARAYSKSAARSKVYPSPPMSGSPPLPPKGTQASAVQRSRGSYRAATQDDHRGISATQMDAQPHQASLAGGALERSFAAEPQEGPPPYGFQRPEPATDRPATYYQQLQTSHPREQGQGHPIHQQLSYWPPSGPSMGPSAAPPTYPHAMTTSSDSRPPMEQQEGPPQSSPKLQRKTKGHVASACVPCKRAHLR